MTYLAVLTLHVLSNRDDGWETTPHFLWEYFSSWFFLVNLIENSFPIGPNILAWKVTLILKGLSKKHKEIDMCSFCHGSPAFTPQVSVGKGPNAPRMDLFLVSLKLALLNTDRSRTMTAWKFNTGFTSCLKEVRPSRALCCHSYTIVFTQTTYLV